jgi:hypothetical protein
VGELPDVAGLSLAALDVRSEGRDWSKGYGETWEYSEAPTCPYCGCYADWDRDERVWRCEVDSCEDSEVEPDTDGPMMNFSYDLPTGFPIHHDDPHEAAHAIRELPLCVVRFRRVGPWACSYALALTGGGMDLSWEICEAFMRLGYLPPVAFADLPEMAGYPANEVHRWVVEGCLRAFREHERRAACEAEWATAKLRRMARYEPQPDGAA